MFQISFLNDATQAEEIKICECSEFVDCLDDEKRNFFEGYRECLSKFDKNNSFMFIQFVLNNSKICSCYKYINQDSVKDCFDTHASRLKSMASATETCVFDGQNGA